MEVVDVDPDKHCEQCRNGYYGRIAIQEVLLINDEIREAINNNTISREQLRELVYKSDVTTLLQDGLNKVLEGITTFEEIYKNVAIDNELDEKYEDEIIDISNNQNMEAMELDELELINNNNNLQETTDII